MSQSGQFENLLWQKKLEVSFSCVYSVIDNEIRGRKIVKLVSADTLGYRLVDPWLLWQCYDEIYDQWQDRRMKNGRQFANLLKS